MASPDEKPQAGERAEQLCEDAFRYVRLTQTLAATNDAGAIAVRSAVIALAVKYNLGGTEVVEMSALAAWRLRNNK